MAATKKNTHVPKFGNWDAEDVAYTKFFEKARKGKDDVPRRFNPNDPEENPDAFPSVIFAAGRGPEKQQYNDQSFDSYVMNRPQGQPQSREDSQSRRDMRIPSRGSSYSYKSSRNHDQSQQDTGNPNKGSQYSSKSGREDDQSQREMGTLTHHRKESPNSNRSGNHKHNNSESSRNTSNYGNSVLYSQYHNEPSKYTKEGSYIVSSSTPTAVKKTGGLRQAQTPRNKTVLPKFGIWDSMDHSGESFSLIFSKVKEEKHNAATTLPFIPDEPLQSRARDENHKKASRFSKMLPQAWWRFGILNLFMLLQVCRCFGILSLTLHNFSVHARFLVVFVPHPANDNLIGVPTCPPFIPSGLHRVSAKLLCLFSGTVSYFQPKREVYKQ